MQENLQTEFAVKVGKALALIRTSKGYTQQFVAVKLGFADQGAYGKIERGSFGKVDMLLLLKACAILDCNLVHLMLLAGVDIFETRIQTGSEFVQSLSVLSAQQQDMLLKEFNQLLKK